MTRDLTWGRRYLMCPPTYFDVSYAINPWMDVTVQVDRVRAQRQWDTLVATLREAGAQVETLEPHPSLPDLVFTANLGIVDDRTFIPARMRHPERQAEPGYAEAWFRDHGYGVRRLSEDVVQEGAGDALPFGETLVAADSARLIERLVPDPIALTDAEAEAFSANTIVIGRTLVMPACSPRLE